MQVRTKAIVLSSIKYGDTSLIVRCYTEQEGVKSYLLRGILKSKKGKLKPAYFQPLSQIDIVGSHSKKGTLNSIKEVSVLCPYESIYTDFTKQAIVFFIAEMLSNSIKEEESNPDLFTYIQTAITWLDLHDKVANFHFVFLMNLTKYLGFYPYELDADKEVFSLGDGVFSGDYYQANTIKGQDLQLFKSILGIKFDEIGEVSLNVHSRQRLLEIILTYFELHLVSFKKPKSIQVLKNLFS